MESRTLNNGSGLATNGGAESGLVCAPPVCRYWLVDDHDEYRKFQQLLLQTYDHLDCTGSFCSADAALAELALVDPPDIILMDVNMPRTSGIDAIPLVRALAPETRILLVTTFTNIVHMRAALSAGASGYLTKTCSREELVSAILTAMNNPAPIPRPPPVVVTRKIAPRRGWLQTMRAHLAGIVSL